MQPLLPASLTCPQSLRHGHKSTVPWHGSSSVSLHRLWVWRSGVATGRGVLPNGQGQHGTAALLPWLIPLLASPVLGYSGKLPD